MRSDNLKRHMKKHDKHVDDEPLPTISSTYTPPVYERSDYNPTNLEDEVLLKKMLKCDREYKEKMDMGKKCMNMLKNMI